MKRVIAVVAGVLIGAGVVAAGLVLTAGHGLTPAQQQAQTDRWIECHVNPGGPLPMDAAENARYWKNVKRECRGNEGSLPPG
jgi:hypothetical protein